MAADEHRRWEEDLAAYALGALEREERAELERHVEGCEHCRRDLDWLRASVDLVPLTVEPKRPPESLKRELMATVREEAAGETRGERETGRPSLLDRLRRVGSPLPALAAAATLAIGLVVGYVAGDTQTEPGPTTLAAEATPVAPEGSHGTVIVVDDAAMVSVGGLSQPREGRVYQAWLRDGEELEPSSLIVLDHAGEGVTAIPHSVEGFDEVLLTEEPPGGSRQPTSAPLLRAELN